MTCETIRDLLEEYAVGTLPADERAAVEAHLATCPDCRARAREIDELASALPPALGAASVHRLPPALKGRVLARLPSAAADAPIRPNRTTRNGREPVSGPLSPEAPADANASAPVRGPAFWRRPRYLSVLAASLVALVGLGWGAWQSAALAHEQVIRAEYAQLVGQQQTVIEVIDSPRTSKAQLRAAAPGSPAYGRLYTRADSPFVVVFASKLPAAPSGQVYQLWLTDSNGTRLAGTMQVDQKGFGLLVYQADHPGPQYLSADLVLQPSGSRTPDGTVAITWKASP